MAMMGYSVFRVKDATINDFEDEISPDRVILYTKYRTENGLEISSEFYDETGRQIISRTEIDYDDQNREIEQREFMETNETPFEIRRKKYNERGQLTLTEICYEDQEPITERNEYDSTGRLILETHNFSEGNLEKNVYSYLGDNPAPATHSFFVNEECIHESKFNYERVNGKFELIEEIFEDKKDRFKSRIRKFYNLGEVPNNVIEEVYNTEGDFLEEVRAVTDNRGNLLRRSWHTDDGPESSPYMGQISEYDSANRILSETTFYREGASSIKRMRYDMQGRKLKEYSFMSPSEEVFLYKYDQQ